MNTNIAHIQVQILSKLNLVIDNIVNQHLSFFKEKGLNEVQIKKLNAYEYIFNPHDYREFIAKELKVSEFNKNFLQAWNTLSLDSFSLIHEFKDVLNGNKPIRLS